MPLFDHEIDQWKNFEDRINDPKLKDISKDKNELIRYWVSYRGQTLARTGQIAITSLIFHTTSDCKFCCHSTMLSVLYFARGIPVRGMMYYREALELQYFLDFAEDKGAI